MTSTALGAETKKEEKIIFISDAHEKFYYEKLKEVRYQDVYHKALCYFKVVRKKKEDFIEDEDEDEEEEEEYENEDEESEEDSEEDFFDGQEE